MFVKGATDDIDQWADLQLSVCVTFMLYLFVWGFSVTFMLYLFVWGFSVTFMLYLFVWGFSVTFMLYLFFCFFYNWLNLSHVYTCQQTIWVWSCDITCKYA